MKKKILTLTLAVSTVGANQATGKKLHSLRSITEKSFSLLGRIAVGANPARGNHTITKAFPSLARTLPSKQSGELFARGKVGMGGSICHIKQPTPTLPIHGGRKVNSPRPQRFLVGEGRISMRKLSIRNAGEGTTHTNTPPLKKLPSLAREGLRVGLFPARGKAAFTLAEVLITLAIIGVVAALTLPTLIAKVNEKVDGNQKKVTEAKLIQGLNMLDLHGGINNTYSSTAEFVEELSKYMKITKICDGTNSAFTECIPYNEVSFIDMDKKLKTTTVENLQTLSKIGLINPFMKPAAITLADGTPMILSYKKDCISDPDSIKSDNKVIHSCVAGVYDLNYHHKPNMFGKDLIGFNGAHIGIFSKIGDYYILAPAATPPAKNCETYKNDFPEIISHCPYSGESDYWVGALVTCKEMGGHLPTMTELANIAKAVYPNITSGDAIGKYSGTSYGSWNTTEVAKLGIAPSSVSAFLLWSSEEYSTTSNGARIRTFRSGDTHASNYAHTGTGLMFVCLADN